MLKNSMAISIVLKELKYIGESQNGEGRIADSLVPVIESLSINKSIKQSDIDNFVKQCTEYNKMEAK